MKRQINMDVYIDIYTFLPVLCSNYETIWEIPNRGSVRIVINIIGYSWGRERRRRRRGCGSGKGIHAKALLDHIGDTWWVKLNPKESNSYKTATTTHSWSERAASPWIVPNVSTMWALPPHFLKVSTEHNTHAKVLFFFLSLRRRERNEERQREQE